MLQTLVKKNINLEKYNVTRGDLILFRFDLPPISPDPDMDLTFDVKGRWTMVLPYIMTSFKIYICPNCKKFKQMPKKSLLFQNFK